MHLTDQGTEIAPYVTYLDLFKCLEQINRYCSLREFSLTIQMPLTDQVTDIAPYVRTSLHNHT